MSMLGVILICIAAGWIGGCYYFLFRKQSTLGSKPSSRSERDVITFHSHETIVPLNTNTPATEISNEVTLYTELIPTPQPAHTPIPPASFEISDDDLIDIRTLSLNINQN